MRTYTQLTQEQRYQIYALKKMGPKPSQIASCLGVHKSTLSRELRRNSGLRSYRPTQSRTVTCRRHRETYWVGKQAHKKALERPAQKVSRRGTSETWALVEEKLRLDWSPEQISGWLKGNSDAQVSPEWIYHYIYADKGSGGDLHKHLRCQKKRPKRYGSRARRGKIPNQVSIAQRPAVVAQRKRVGDWEADTSIGKGKRQALTLRDTRRGASPWLIACLALPD